MRNLPRLNSSTSLKISQPEILFIVKSTECTLLSLRIHFRALASSARLVQRKKQHNYRPRTLRHIIVSAFQKLQ